jgi:CRISPR-associated protein Cmr3
MWVFIEPTDVWLFRDSRSFSAGEGHRARSLFPPTPFTVQGAIRSLLLGSSPVDWIAFREQSSEAARALGRQIGYPVSNNRPPSLGQVSIAGPFLARREEDRVVRFVPLPADVVKVKDEDRYLTLRPTEGLPFESDWPFPRMAPLWLKEGSNLERPEGLWLLSEPALRNYLDEKAFAPLRGEDLFGIEPRFGIALDYSRRRPVPSMLYQAGFVRPASGVGLLVQLEGVSMPSAEGLMALGGEARGARYTVLNPKDVLIGTGQSQPAKRLKLVFLTPTYFADGWLPAGSDWSPFFDDVSIRLVAAALDRSQRIGGWDVARRRPKVLRGFVPAGSVYYFEADKGISPPKRPVTETPPDELPMDCMGFGQVAVGTWDWLSL